MAKVIVRIYGPEIRKAVTKWAARHLTAAHDPQANVYIYKQEGGKYNWDLTDEVNPVYLDVEFTSELNTAVKVNVRVTNLGIRTAITEWIKKHLVMAHDPYAHITLHKTGSDDSPWNLEDAEDPVYIDVEFDSEYT